MSTPEPAQSLRDRLADLLDDYDQAVRGTEDRYVATYLRACLSAMDATRLRVNRQLRRGTEPAAWSARPTTGSVRPTSDAAMYRGAPRPEAIGELTRQHAIAHTRHPVVSDQWGTPR